MGHSEKTSNTAFYVPFLLVIAAAAFLILVSDMDKPTGAEEPKTEEVTH